MSDRLDKIAEQAAAEIERRRTQYGVGRSDYHWVILSALRRVDKRPELTEEVADRAWLTYCESGAPWDRTSRVELFQAGLQVGTGYRMPEADTPVNDPFAGLPEHKPEIVNMGPDRSDEAEPTRPSKDDMMARPPKCDCERHKAMRLMRLLERIADRHASAIAELRERLDKLEAAVGRCGVLGDRENQE